MRKLLTGFTLLILLCAAGMVALDAFSESMNVKIPIASSRSGEFQERLAETKVQEEQNVNTHQEKKPDATTAMQSQDSKKRTPVFDATLYKNKNIENEKFFIPIRLLYQSSLFQDKGNRIDPDYLQEVAEKLPKSNIPYILDIEIWDVHTTDDIEANANIDKYILVIDTMKKARPDLKFGYYGVLPNRDYWSPVSNDPKKLADWKRINQRLKRLAEHVDVICPSLYTFYDDPDGWKKFALENIKRAREYGKPVYAFIWPQYHNSNRLLGGKFVDTRVWLEQLRLVEQESDGVIIWGGWDLDKNTYGPMQWDENSPWWKITKRHIAGE